MCGILGHTIGASWDVDHSRRALNTLTHRGPDQWGEWHDERVYIGHRRLSILDLSERGRQPMVGTSGRVIIAVNGEIYNYPVLRKQLESSYEFRSTSDSEIILHGYAAWGIRGLLDRIEGMYAFSVYDRDQQRIYLARDRVGIKPLYYAKIGPAFAWASELKALTTLFGRDSLPIDYTSAYDFLTYLYVPTPKTLYRNVFKLPPAHYLEYDLNQKRLACHAYWSLDVRTEGAEADEASREIARLVDESVEEQFMSDVPVGVFLSGGMDSSAVAASAVRHSSDIQTFSIGFDVPEHDESRYARRVSEHLGTSHHERLCGPDDAADLFDAVREWYDEPFADSSLIPTHMVSRFARERITVALSGDGGDELFGGYRWYDAMRRRRRLLRPLRRLLRPLTLSVGAVQHRSLAARAVRRAGFDFIWDDLEMYVVLMGGLLKEDKKSYARLWDIDPDYDDYWYFRKYHRPDYAPMTRWQYLDFHTYLHDDILTKVDRASMRVALEVRVPLLSTALVEFAFSLPEEVRYAGGQLKGLFKSAFRDRLPSDIIARGKRGFSIPAKAWGMVHSGARKSMQEEILERSFGYLLERRD